MNEISRVSNVSQALTQVRPSGYQGSNDVKFRANVDGGRNTAEQSNALKRLDNTMAANESPRVDVPRGFYLNILV